MKGFSCNWSKTIYEMIRDVKELGFNTIRVPLEKILILYIYR
jgi:aryl-phospho-beta-D-glucosidase BglC (GH1 family)